MIQPGRGRKPAFSPQHDEAEAGQVMRHIVSRAPMLWGYAQSRWTLHALLEVCPFTLSTPSGLWRLMDRLGLSYKRGRHYIHSPDPHYWEKLRLIELARLKAWYELQRYVFLYQDELTYYRQPTLSMAYEQKGSRQLLAHQSYHKNNAFRIAAALNAITGQVAY